MKHSEINTADHFLWALLSLYFVGLGFLALVAAWSGFFNEPLLLTASAVGLFAVIWTLRKYLNKEHKPSKEFLIILSVAFLITLAYSAFSWNAAPSIFSGRDQGSLAEAAIRLAENQKLSFSTPQSDAFFKIYGPGRALNFPGFFYTPEGNLHTQFPLGYIAWLATFYSFFDLAGLRISNALLAFMFLVSFHLVARQIVSRRSAWVALFAAAISFPFVWFQKYTLSENMALALLWQMILFLILFFQTQTRLAYFGFLATSFLLVFTRIEGIAFLGMGLLFLLAHPKTRGYLKEKFTLHLILPLLIFVTLFFLNYLNDSYFYRSIGKATLGFLVDTTAPITASKTFLESLSYFIGVHIRYGLLWYFTLGTLGILIALHSKKRNVLITLIVVLPSFLYFFDAYISSDHPWMLRRFLFSLLPTFILYASLLLDRAAVSRSLIKKFTVVTLFVFALGHSVWLLTRYLPANEHPALLPETEKMAANFSEKDLVLLDRTASGDGWAMFSGPLNFLYGKNATYFFNTKDLTKLNLDNFDKVFLVTPAEHKNLYLSSDFGNRLRFISHYGFADQFIPVNIESTDTLLPLPRLQTTEVTGTIYEIIK